MHLIVFVLLLFTAGTAHAYVGPGLGLGVLGAIFGTIAAVVMAIAGVVWYPVKRLLKRKNLAAQARREDGKA